MEKRAADRTPYTSAVAPEEVKEAIAVLDDLERIIYETMPPDQAEAAYLAALRHLFHQLSGEAVLATERLLKRASGRK